MATIGATEDNMKLKYTQECTIWLGLYSYVFQAIPQSYLLAVLSSEHVLGGSLQLSSIKPTGCLCVLVCATTMSVDPYLYTK